MLNGSQQAWESDVGERERERDSDSDSDGLLPTHVYMVIAIYKTKTTEDNIKKKKKDNLLTKRFYNY